MGLWLAKWIGLQLELEMVLSLITTPHRISQHHIHWSWLCLWCPCSNHVGKISHFSPIFKIFLPSYVLNDLDWSSSACATTTRRSPKRRRWGKKIFLGCRSLQGEGGTETTWVGINQAVTFSPVNGFMIMNHIHCTMRVDVHTFRTSSLAKNTVDRIWITRNGVGSRTIALWRQHVRYDFFVKWCF